MFVIILSYSERKLAVREDFEEFHIKMGYPLPESLYATIGEAAYSPLYTQTDEICIYIAFALMLSSQSESISFMLPRLRELANEKNMPQYEQELGIEFPQFLMDLNIIAPI